MRNATVVLAVLAIAAMAAPAFGASVWNAGDDSWHTPGNWTGGEPAAGVETIVDNGGTARISDDAAAGLLWIGNAGASGGGTVSQSAGDAVFSLMGITDVSTAFGRYEISGGTLDSGSYILVGSRGGGDGRFKVVGSNSSVSVGHFNVYAGATWEIVLDAAGVTKVVADENINPYGGDYFSGALTLDASAYSVTGTHTIDILECTSRLDDYSNLTLDAASKAAGWSLTHTGSNDGLNPGTLQLTIPEPATMVLLSIGGIGVLIRRRRR